MGSAAFERAARAQAFELGKEGAAVFMLQHQYATHGVVGDQHAGQKLAKLAPARRMHKQGKAPPHQPLAHGAQLPAAAQVELLDKPAAIEREIAHRGKIVEVHILLPGRFGSGLCLLQLFVLHFELNLMDLQLLQQPLHFLRRLLVGGLGHELTALLGAGT